MFQINSASGWILNDFSRYNENVILLELVCHFQVQVAEAYDSNNEKVKMGEAGAGLHYVEKHVRQGVRLLDDSWVKTLEEVSYRNWQQQQEKQATDGAIRLEFDPEWKARGKAVPTGDMKKKMSKLVGGGFAVTYRKKFRPDEAEQELMRQFAVKVMDRGKMEDLGITEENVRHEARILDLMRHENVLRYVGLEETDEEMGIIMELMAGGSITDFIKQHPDTHPVSTEQALEIMMQMAGAMD